MTPVVLWICISFPKWFPLLPLYSWSCRYFGKGYSEAFVSNEQLNLVSLAIEKAYEMIWKERLITILFNVCLKGVILAFIFNFLFNRTEYKLPDKFDIVNWVPQGSVSSVTLFLLAINRILNTKTPVKNVFCLLMTFLWHVNEAT